MERDSRERPSSPCSPCSPGFGLCQQSQIPEVGVKGWSTAGLSAKRQGTLELLPPARLGDHREGAAQRKQTSLPCSVGTRRLNGAISLSSISAPILPNTRGKGKGPDPTGWESCRNLIQLNGKRRALRVGRSSRSTRMCWRHSSSAGTELHHTQCCQLLNGGDSAHFTQHQEGHWGVLGSVLGSPKQETL